LRLRAHGAETGVEIFATGAAADARHGEREHKGKRERLLPNHWGASATQLHRVERRFHVLRLAGKVGAVKNGLKCSGLRPR
jgi:hypothetical protein